MSDDISREPGFTYVGLAFGIGAVALLALLSVPPWRHCHHGTNEAAAVGALKTITTSQSVFREGDKEKDGNLDYGMLTELSNVTLIDAVLGRGSKQGYYFSCAYSYLTSDFLWFAVANPQVPTSSGDRYFATSAAGIIYYTTKGHLALDTSTCDLARVSGIVPVGK